MSILENSQFSLFYPEGFLTSSEFKEAVKKRVLGLIAQDIQESDVVLLEPHNPLETLKTLMALIELKALTALINPKLPTVLRHSLIEKLGPYKTLFSIKDLEGPYTFKTSDESIPSILMATSGSLGNPKWIVQSLAHWRASVEGTLKAFNATCYQPWLLSLPLFHVSGLAIFFRALLAHAPLVIDKTPWGSWPYHLSMIPQQLAQKNQQSTHLPLLKMKALLIGGGKMPEVLLKMFKDYPLYLTYGMTEACSQITMSSAYPLTPHEGPPLLHREIKMTEQGTIAIKGPSICDYAWDHGHLIPLKDSEGFYQTGDRGEFIGKNLNLMGREDERIEILGEKIYPHILENTLYSTGYFSKVVITHIQNEIGKTLILAFVSPLPTTAQKNHIKTLTSSLFSPTAYFEIDKEELEIKIPLYRLKQRAAQALWE